MIEKLKTNFEGMIVKKSSSQGVFAALGLPSFIRDWFIKRYADSEGNINVNFISQKIADIMPRKEEWNSWLDRIISGEKVKFLAKISIKINIKTGAVSFVLPDYSVNENTTYISPTVWDEYRNKLLCGNGDIWGIVELSYVKVNDKAEGKINLVSFKDFRPYNVSLDYFKSAREQFNIDEWIDLLLGAIDYNAEGFESQEQKLALLKRMLPFVEKRLNLIELAPKGTGKSYMFSQISKNGWLSSGGVMTRAKMFYDMRLKQDGLVAYYDYVALDEITTIKFPDVNEMQGALKGYLESGVYTVGIMSGNADAGIVMLGNIPQAVMDVDTNMFGTLPLVFNDSALLDRFHGFIEGWDIPRMSEKMKVKEWALNTEYFAEILHALRDDPFADYLTDALLSYPDNADTRDTTAVKRITAAYMKLLFPAWKTLEDVDADLFKKYCLDPAIRMRGIIKKQLCLLDKEYKNVPILDYKLKID